MASDASAALAVRDKVQQFLNAAVTGNLDLLKISGRFGRAASTSEGPFISRLERARLRCKYLLEELKLDVDTKDEDGETALIHAARQSHTGMRILS